MTNLVTRGSIPISSRHPIVIGIVAELKKFLCEQKPLYQFMISYLDPVPKAVANTCPIFATYPYGSRFVARKNKTAIVPAQPEENTKY